MLTDELVCSWSKMAKGRVQATQIISTVKKNTTVKKKRYSGD